MRVVDGGPAAAKVAVGTEDAVTLSPSGTIATTYRVIPGGKSLTITIDGKTAAPITVPPDKFLTLVYRPSAAGPKLTTITDDPGEDNGLLAQLRFYNLVPNCAGSLAIEGGPAVFDGVATDASKSRSINPVSATLVPKCGAAAGAGLKLPPLKAGDHYSIFLTGDAAKPVAVGNADATNPTRAEAEAEPGGALVFSSFSFVFLFFPVFLVVYRFAPASWRNAVILVFSWIFYAWWRLDFLPLLIFILQNPRKTPKPQNPKFTYNL